MVGNTLLQEYTLDGLPEQVEIVVDLHLRPYYDDEVETDGLYYSEAKDGTTAFHAYATLYARVRNKRYTLAVTPSLRSFSDSSNNSTSQSRQSTLTVNSTMPSVSPCSTPTTTPT